tara:strand:+ start:93629 stop:94132 length:504 start_codon:yes stop_codon:yes gene_type:complete
MELSDSIRNLAKLDSRRFAKGIVCRIVVGPLLDIAYREGLVPAGININEKTGLDPVNNKMFAIPSVAYKEVERLAKDYQTSTTKEQTEEVDLAMLETITQSRSGLVTALKQNLVLITLTPNIPQGKLAGLPPETHDVVIDSLDVNQSIEGYYVYRTKGNVRKNRDIR